MYANTVTGSMQRAIDETMRRRTLQMNYNKEHGIVPKTVRKDIRKAIETIEYAQNDITSFSSDDIQLMIENLTDEMLSYAENLEFEKAAQIRDRISELKKKI